MTILNSNRGAPASQEIRNNQALSLAGTQGLASLQTIFSEIDERLADSLSRPTIIFHSDAACLYTGTQVENSDSSIEIRIVQTTDGQIRKYQIPTGQNIPVLTNGDICYAILARDGSGTGTVPSTNLTFANGNLITGTATLPPLTSQNVYYVPILMRIDGALNKKYIHWFFGHGVWGEGSSAQVGLAGTADDPENTASLLSMRAENRWYASKYEFITDNIIARYQDRRIDNVNFPFTAQLNQQQNAVEFPQSGLSFVTTNLADSYFLENGSDIFDCEVLVFYDRTKKDPQPLVQISRDGGQNFFTLDYEGLPGTDLYFGTHYFDDTSTPVTIGGFQSGGSNQELSPTSKFLTQRILGVSSSSYCNDIQIGIRKTGAPDGAIRLRIVKESGSGTPSNLAEDVWATTSWISLSSLPAGLSLQTFLVKSIIPKGSYHIVIECTEDYYLSYSLSNLIQIDCSQAAALTRSFVSADGSSWQSLSTTVRHIVRGRLVDLRVKVTSSVGGTELAGIAVLYGSRKTIESGFINENIFTFSDNRNEFTLDFIPDHRSLTAYVRGTGQVFRFGDFTIQDKKVIFPVNFFQDSGTQNTIEFVQQFGYSIDNADKNASLLRENGLGSLSPELDVSEAGKGIKLRASNGVLVHASIQWNGTSYQWQFTPL